MNDNVVFQSFDKEDVFQVYLEILPVRFHEDTFIFYVFHAFLVFVQQQGVVGDRFIHRLAELGGVNRFDQIIDRVDLVTVEGVFRIGCREDNERVFGDAAGKLNAVYPGI